MLPNDGKLPCGESCDLVIVVKLQIKKGLVLPFKFVNEAVDKI